MFKTVSRSIFCFAFLLAQTLSAATIFVGPPPASIQTAVNAANNGDTVQLSAGTYIQEVQVISKSINIVGAGQDVTIIQAPNATTHLTQNFVFGGVNWWCILMVDNQAAPTPQTVNISDLTVDGSDQQDALPIYGSPDRFFAIGYHNANGTVTNSHTTNTRQTMNFNELAGGGIVNASDVGNVVFNVTDSLVDFYQRIGIDCRGVALTANITNNIVDRGYFLTPNTSTATPNGIQFLGSTTGSILNNTVSSNISTVGGTSATGIIPFGGGANITVSGNILNNNDVGIAAITNGSNLSLSNNTFNFNTVFSVNPNEGTLLQDNIGPIIISNNIFNNIPDVNLDIISSTDVAFQLSNNQFIGSQTGLMITGSGAAGPIVTMNGDSFTGTAGYYIQEVAAPNDVWPSTATVSFDGLVSGHMSFAEFNQVLTKIFDQHNDPALGLVLDFIPPLPPTLFSISPNSGPTTGGTAVTITGVNFLSSATSVNFGVNPAASFIIVSDTTIIAISPPGVAGVVDVTVTTLFGTTPIVPEDQFTYINAAPLPPTNAVGQVFKDKFVTQTVYLLEASWVASASPDVVLYRIYSNGILVGEVPAGSPLIFVARLLSTNYQITAVNSLGLESVPVAILLVYGSCSR